MPYPKLKQQQTSLTLKEGLIVVVNDFDGLSEGICVC